MACLFAVPLLAQNGHLLLLDDFSGQNAAWLFHRDGSVKNDPAAIESGKGYLKIRLLNPVKQQECNVGISNPQPVYTKKYRQLTCETRIKTLNTMMPGSRGWGFWKTAKNGAADNLAWFMQQFLKGEADHSWSRFGSLYKRQAKWQAYTPRAGEWHTYKIVRDLLLNTTIYFIDGKRVFSTPGIAARGRMAFHLWIDNQVYSRSKGIRRAGWRDESAMQVDYVMIYDGPSAAESSLPEGSIKLDEKPRFFFDPNSAKAPPVYHLGDVNGSGWLIASVNAEPLPGDYLKTSIKSEHENHSIIWDGTGSATRFIKLQAVSGMRINFESRETPYLDRFLLLNSPSGRVVFDHKAGLRKKHTFKSDSGNFVFIIATRFFGKGSLMLDAKTTGARRITLDSQSMLTVRRLMLPAGTHTVKLDVPKDIAPERIFIYQE